MEPDPACGSEVVMCGEHANFAMHRPGLALLGPAGDRKRWADTAMLGNEFERRTR